MGIHNLIRCIYPFAVSQAHRGRSYLFIFLHTAYLLRGVHGHGPMRTRALPGALARVRKSPGRRSHRKKKPHL
uniref:Uncharacterized protein n=1 Tax=Picea sitchensis TaxID=3332 RepID=A0A6B9XQB8_PICSI|nr:hypothetical protein Q903MT_gene4293 [Picea sitchensis]